MPNRRVTSFFTYLRYLLHDLAAAEIDVNTWWWRTNTIAAVIRPIHAQRLRPQRLRYLRSGNTPSVRVEQQALRPVLGGVGVRAGPTLCEQVAVHGENPLRPPAHQQF